MSSPLEVGLLCVQSAAFDVIFHIMKHQNMDGLSKLKLSLISESQKQENFSKGEIYARYRPEGHNTVTDDYSSIKWKRNDLARAEANFLKLEVKLLQHKRSERDKIIDRCSREICNYASRILISN